MVEHSTADREVPGSNPGAPSFFFFFFFFDTHYTCRLTECSQLNFSFPQFYSRLLVEELAVYAKELQDLKEFLDSNPHLCKGAEVSSQE